jgi:hypothetical protein
MSWRDVLTFMQTAKTYLFRAGKDKGQKDVLQLFKSKYLTGRIEVLRDVPHGIKLII